MSPMEYTTRRVVGSLVVCSLVLAVFLPSSAEAATAKKKAIVRSGGVSTAALANPVSRCVTAASKKTRQSDVKTLVEDGKKFEGIEEEAHPLFKAYKKYKTDLEFAWGAMEEPYCGFGSNGYSAAFKSYQKTIVRARAAFLDAVKKHKAN